MTTVVLDEFYSWYQYPDDESKLGYSVSGAAYVEDVNEVGLYCYNKLISGLCCAH